MQLREDARIIIPINYCSESLARKTCNRRTAVRETAHTEKYFRNLIKSNRNQIVFTIFRLIGIQTDVRLDPNQSVHCTYNLISV